MPSPTESASIWNSSPPVLKVTLQLESLPPIFISETHLDTCELHELEDDVVEAGGILTYDMKEAKIVLTKAERKRRIQLDLRTKGCYTEEVVPIEETTPAESKPDLVLDPATKRQRLSQAEELGKFEDKSLVIDDASTDSEVEEEARSKAEPVKRKRKQSSIEQDPNQGYFSNGYIKVLRLQWFLDSRKQNTILPIEPYLLYQGRQVEKPQEMSSPVTAPSSANKSKYSAQSILERARADAAANATSPTHQHGQRRLGQIGGGRSRPTLHTKHAPLLPQTTSEHDLGQSSDLPEMPSWVQDEVKYACQRTTPPDSPNAEFIAQLQKIRLARVLTIDEIGVRAYSTSIASLAAYPYKLSSPREVLLLPGCDAKIANLYVEFANYGVVKEAQDAEENEELKVLRLFYDIWGVGATTAREFYYDRGWRDLDDVVEYGWKILTRVQQIGVKYYEEFLRPIPRLEVEQIAATIHRHAAKVRDAGIQSLVVGGYRRGKQDCGDVDIIISHPDESQTLNIITDIVASLEEEKWITHTLLIASTTSNRSQQTLPLNTSSSSTHGHGFDTLDKALVVWQNPAFSPPPSDPKPKNPNPHRRVDIIISPWKTVGCAVMGWSGGTTFQRDLRRYVRQAKGWKFDSSGVRDRGTGKVVDVDGYGSEKTRAKTMEQAERNVFASMGLEWREPWERCTG